MAEQLFDASAVVWVFHGPKTSTPTFSRISRVAFELLDATSIPFEQQDFRSEWFSVRIETQRFGTRTIVVHAWISIYTLTHGSSNIRKSFVHKMGFMNRRNTYFTD